MLRFIVALAVFAGLNSFVQAQAVDLNSLVTRSPFAGLADSNAKPVTADNVIELRGVMEDGGKLWFSLYDTTAKRSEWLPSDARTADYAFESFNAENNTLRATYKGRSYTLTLKDARIIPLQNAGLGASGNNLPSPLPRPPEAAPAVNASETQRLAAIAEEIRRRRALRQTQAAEPQNPPASPDAAKSN